MNRENMIGLVLLLAALVAVTAICLTLRGRTARESAEAPAEAPAEETREPLPTVQPPRPPQPGEAARKPRPAHAVPLKQLAVVLDGPEEDRPAEDNPEAPGVRVAYGAEDMERETAVRAADADEDTSGADVDTGGMDEGTRATDEDTRGAEEEPEADGDTGREAGETMVYIGEYQITGYDLCAGCCGKTDGITASGTAATVGRTAACASLPFGTRVYIEGIGERVVEDTGGLASTAIDVLCADHAGCYAITGKRAVYQITGLAA